LVFCI